MSLGSAQGFFLLKASFSVVCVCGGVGGVRLWVSLRNLQAILIVREAISIVELNIIDDY